MSTSVLCELRLLLTRSWGQRLCCGLLPSARGPVGLGHVNRRELHTEEKEERADAVNQHCHGEGVPGGPSTSFLPLGLSPLLMEPLKRLGVRGPSDVQALAIPRILEGQSVALDSCTGSGKTLAYLLPTLSQILSASTPPKGCCGESQSGAGHPDPEGGTSPLG